MPVASDVYFYDLFNGSGFLEDHAPNIGSAWFSSDVVFSHSGDLNDGKVEVVAGKTAASYRSAQQASAQDSVEKVFRFTVPTFDVTRQVRVGIVTSSGIGWRAIWTFQASPNDSIIALESQHNLLPLMSVQTMVPTSAGTHEIRIIGEGDTITAYFDGKGLRITEVPAALRIYDHIGFHITPGITMLECWGKNGAEPDFVLLFDPDFGPVGGPSGGSGGGGGSGGSPGGGGDNPANIPCDPGETLVINNGQAVSLAPTDPCMWTGLIWWKLICESVLTEADYAVEAEVFFNTLTDSFMSVGVIARLDEATGGHYFAALWNAEIVIGKKPSAAGDDIIFATKPLTLKAGTWYTIRLEIEGSKLRAYLDDELQLTAIDPNSSFGEPGCAGVRLSRGNPATDIRIDNFRVWLNVRRPDFAEAPVFLDSISVSKDDGMDVEVGVVIADSLTASETLTMLVPKTVHINEGVVFTDTAGQVKRIQEFLLGLDSMDLGIGINIQDVLTAAEKLGLNMNIPVTDVINFTDEERTIHGVSDTITVQEFIAQFLEGGVPDRVGASDSVRVIKTSVAAYAPPELTFYARDLKRLRTVETGKKVR